MSITLRNEDGAWNSLRRAIQSHRGKAFKLADKSTTGIPDFVAHWMDMTWWGELKYKRRINVLEQVSEKQRSHLRMLLNYGNVAHVVYYDPHAAELRTHPWCLVEAIDWNLPRVTSELRVPTAYDLVKTVIGWKNKTRDDGGLLDGWRRIWRPEYDAPR